MNPFIFTLFGPLAVSWYGFFVVLGVSLFIYFAYNDMRRSAIASTDKFFDCALAGVFGGLVGGKITFVLMSVDVVAVKSWYELVALLTGGFAVLGAIIGAVLGIVLAARIHQIELLPLLDLSGAYALLAHGVARIGCLIAGCCYGVPLRMSSYAIMYDHPAHLAPLHVPLLPVQLLMSIVSLSGFFVCYYAYQVRGRRDGWVFALYVCIEAGSRFVLDFWRGDREHIVYGLSAYQWLALVIIACAVTSMVAVHYVWYTRRRW